MRSGLYPLYDGCSSSDLCRLCQFATIRLVPVTAGLPAAAAGGQRTITPAGQSRTASGTLPAVSIPLSAAAPKAIWPGVGLRVAARGGDKHVDLLADECRKLARSESIDCLQHPRIHPLRRVPRE